MFGDQFVVLAVDPRLPLGSDVAMHATSDPARALDLCGVLADCEIDSVIYLTEPTRPGRPIVRVVGGAWKIGDSL